MAKRNYSQYSKKNDDETKVRDVLTTDETPVAEPIIEEVLEVKPVVESVETVALPETVEGIVTNCAKLNVRVAPNASADVVCVLDAKSEIEIVVAKSTDEWFNVCTATGIEGYCMRKFVDARL